MVDIPKYCALPEAHRDSGDMIFFGIGKTAREAINNFAMRDGGFCEYCEYSSAVPGKKIQIVVHSVIDIDKSDYSANDLNPNWKWCLDKMIFTVHVTVPSQVCVS